MTTKICQHRPLFYDDMSINMVNNIRVNMHVKGAANCGHKLDHKSFHIFTAIREA